MAVVKEYKIERVATYKETFIVVVEGDTEAIRQEQINKLDFKRLLFTERELVSEDNKVTERINYSE